MQINKKKALTAGAGLVVIVLIVFGGYYLGKFLKAPKTVAKVGNQKITETDLDMELAFASKASTDQEKLLALKQLINCKIAENQADKYDLSVSDTEVANSIKNVIGSTFEDYSDFQKDVIRENTRCRILEYKVQSEYIAWAEGNYLAVNVPKDNPSLDTEASELADKLAEEMTNGKISFEKAKATLEANGSFGLKASTSPIYATFDRNAFLNNYDIFADSTVKEKVFGYLKVAPSGDDIAYNHSLFPQIINKASAEGETTSVFALPILVQEQSVTTTKGLASRYLIIDINDKQRGQYSSYDEYIKAAYDGYNVSYKINSELNSKKDSGNYALASNNVPDISQTEYVAGIYYIDQKGNKVPLDLVKDGKTNVSFSINNDKKSFQKSSIDKYVYSSDKNGQVNINLPNKITDKVASNIPPNTDKNGGYWLWDSRGTANGSTGTTSISGEEKVFDLGAITSKGKAYYNEFVWVPSYQIPVDVNLVSPGNGSLLVSNNVIVQAGASTEKEGYSKIKVRYKPIKETKWEETSWHPGTYAPNGTLQSFELKDLKTATTYEWQAMSITTNDAESIWTESLTFNTAREKLGQSSSAIVATATSENIDNGADITFNGKAENADFYVWDFGDGNTSEDLANTADTHHIYQTGGDVTAILTAYKDVPQSDSLFNKQKDYSGHAIVAQKEVKFFVNLPIEDSTTPTTETEEINMGEDSAVSSLNENEVAVNREEPDVLGSAFAAPSQTCIAPVLSAIYVTGSKPVARDKLKVGARYNVLVNGDLEGSDRKIDCGYLKYSINWGDKNNENDNISFASAGSKCRVLGSKGGWNDKEFSHVFKVAGYYTIVLTAHYYKDGVIKPANDCIRAQRTTVKVGNPTPPSTSGCSLKDAQPRPPRPEHQNYTTKINEFFRFSISGAKGADTWKIFYSDGGTDTSTGNSPSFSHKYKKTGTHTVTAYGYYLTDPNHRKVPCSPQKITFKVNVVQGCNVELKGTEKLTPGQEGTYTATGYKDAIYVITATEGFKEETKKAKISFKNIGDKKVTVKLYKSRTDKANGKFCASDSVKVRVSESGNDDPPEEQEPGGGGGGGGGTDPDPDPKCDNKVWEIRGGECKLVTNSCKTAVDNCKCGIKSVKIVPDPNNPFKYTFTVVGAGPESKAFKVSFGDGSPAKNKDSNTFSYTYKKAGSYKVVIRSWPSESDRNKGKMACDKFSTNITVRSCNTGTFTADKYTGDTTAGPVNINFANSNATNVGSYTLKYGDNAADGESASFDSTISSHDYTKGTYRPALEGFDAEGQSCGVVSLDKQIRLTGPSTSTECKIGNLSVAPAEGGEATKAKPLPVKFTSTGNEGVTYFRLRWGDGVKAGEISDTQGKTDITFDHSYKGANFGSSDGSYTAILQAYKDNPADGTQIDCGSVSVNVPITNFVGQKDFKCDFTGTLTAKPKSGKADNGGLEVKFNAKTKKANGADKTPNRWHINYGDSSNPGHGTGTVQGEIATFNKKNKHVYNYKGTYSVLLTGSYITDKGEYDTCGSIATTVNVTSGPELPENKCTVGSLKVNPTSGKVNDKFTFDLSGMSNSRVLFIEYGDGKTEQKTNFRETKLTLNHTYTAPSPTEGYKMTVVGSLGIGSDLVICGSQSAYVKVSGTQAKGSYLCSESNQCIFGGGDVCPDSMEANCYLDDPTCKNQCPCVTEGESLGAVVPGNNKKCCSGLVVTPPGNGIVGSRGTCEKPSSQVCAATQHMCNDGSCVDLGTDCPSSCEEGQKECNGECIDEDETCNVDPGLSGITLSASPTTGNNPLVTDFVIKDKDGADIEAPDSNYKIEIVQVGFESDPQTEEYDGRPFKFCGPDSVTSYKAKAVRVAANSAGKETRIVSNEVTLVVNPSSDKDNCQISASAAQDLEAFNVRETDSAVALDAGEPLDSTEELSVKEKLEDVEKRYKEKNYTSFILPFVNKASAESSSYNDYTYTKNGLAMVYWAREEIGKGCETKGDNKGPRIKVYQKYAEGEKRNGAVCKGCCVDAAWCASFVTYINDKKAKLTKLQTCSVPRLYGKGSSNAKLREITNQNKPKPGDILIKNGKAHTGVYLHHVTKNKTTSYYAIEGNGGDPEVCVKLKKTKENTWSHFISV